MNKMQILLRQLELENDLPVLSNAEIKKVTVNQNDCYHFFIASNEIIPFEEYRRFEKQLQTFPYPAKVSFEVTTPLYLKEEVLNYARYFMLLLGQENPSWTFISDLKMSYDNDTILFEVVNEIQLSSMSSFERRLEQALEQVGFKVYVQAKIDESNDDYQKIKEEMASNIEIAVEKPILKEEVVKPKTPFYRKKNEYVSVSLDELKQGDQFVNIRGFVFMTELTETKTKKHIQTLWVTDYTDSILVKRFENARVSIEEMNKIGKGNVWVEVSGEYKFDSFAKEMLVMANKVEIVEGPKAKEDVAIEKRVELHTHTKMSAMDGLSTISEYVSRAAKWGHQAIAVTDHGNVQSFPEAQQAAAKNKIKMIYGVEINTIDPQLHIVMNEKSVPIEDGIFVSFDLETTGLSVVHDGITEFGAVKIKNGEVIDRMQTFVNPGKEISNKIVNLTHITNDMVKDAPYAEQLVDRIAEFFGDCVIVAHNATFDVGFLNAAYQKAGRPPIQNPIIDTLPLARAILKPMKSYRLGSVARVYRVAYDDEVAHRADYDAEVLGSVLNMMFHQLMNEKIYNINQLNHYQDMNSTYKLVYPYHVTMLAKNKTGLRNMFKLITEANTTYFHDEARLPKELIQQYHEGILVGSSCYKSEVFEACMNSDDQKLDELIDFYDYIEIQPLEDYQHLIERGSIENIENLKKSIRRLIDHAKAKGKLVVATGDVHFLDERDKIYRDVFISNPTIGINHRAHPLCDRKNPRAFTPSCYLRTTDEMLASFEAWMDKDEAFEYVVTNTRQIADMIESFNVVHDKLYTPTIEGADENLKRLCYETAHQMYGEKLPEIVEKRLERELGSIIKHGFGVIYYIAHRLVKKSNEDGYLVGSRGSVGSSFVATMSGITEVNPLPPHYRCPSCTYSEFVDPKEIADGYDLENKNCPVCSQPMIGDGHNIPFETFLGFNADKVPDIDLNFSGDYQWKAHDYTKVLFGEDKVYRAGTISTVAEKTAYGYAKGYSELLGIENSINSAELARIALGCQDVKRTTGQHPGGIIVIPKEMDVYDFTPVQYPADDLNSLWKTTHFDFHAIHDNVLKLDILGHVDPTVIRMLQDLTGIDPKDIPTNDKRVMSLFNSCEAMGIDLSFINCKTGALGLPEFGTPFVRGMLEQTNPSTFNDLVIISGLSHGTDVYLGNAEQLIKSGICTLKEVIGCRDDIMVYLMQHGLEPLQAFKIMEFVRKGMPSKNKEGWQEWVKVLEDAHIDQWYIESCAKIKYMFPKAHAAAYVLSAIRVAWWKLYYPQEYYSVYFTTRCDAYEIETMVKGKEAVFSRRKEIEQLKIEKRSAKKDEDLFGVFDICLEMFERGYRFSNIDLELSDATRFMPHPNDQKIIVPPFSCIDGLGEAVAISVVEARKEHSFISKEDVMKRTRLNNTHIKTLTLMNVFEDLQEENQLSLF